MFPFESLTVTKDLEHYDLVLNLMTILSSDAQSEYIAPNSILGQRGKHGSSAFNEEIRTNISQKKMNFVYISFIFNIFESIKEINS